MSFKHIMWSFRLHEYICIFAYVYMCTPKRKQPCIFIGRTEAEALILGLPDAKNGLIGKDFAAGKD